MKKSFTDRSGRFFRHTTSVALISFISGQAGIPALAQTVRPTPSASPSLTPTQAQQVQAAISALDNAKTAAMVSEAAWGGVSALCGYNCFSYLTELMGQRQIIYGLAQTLNKLVTQTAGQCTDASVAAPASSQGMISASFDKISTDYNQANAGTAQGQAAQSSNATNPAGGSASTPASSTTDPAGGTPASAPASDPASATAPGSTPANTTTAPASTTTAPTTTTAAPATQTLYNYPQPPANVPTSGNLNLQAAPVTPVNAEPLPDPVTPVKVPAGLPNGSYEAPDSGGSVQNEFAPVKHFFYEAAVKFSDLLIPSSFADAAPAAAGPGSASNEAFSQEVTAFVGQVNSMVTTAQTQATAQANAASATGVGGLSAAYIVTCQGSLTSIASISQAIAGKLVAYNQAVTKIVSTGNYCAIAGAVVSVADAGYSMYQGSQVASSNPYEAQLKGNTMQEVMGVAGVAATQAYGIYSELNHTNAIKSEAKTAQAMGISSCATAGFSLFELLMKEKDRESISSSEATDKQELQNYESTPGASPLPSTSSWNEHIRKMENYLASVIPNFTGSLAYADTGGAAGSLSACGNVRESQASFLSCAKASDPLLAQALNGMGGEDRFFSVVEQNLGIGRTQFLNADHPLSPEQIVGIMTANAPQYRSGMLSVIMKTRSELGAHPTTARLLSQPITASSNTSGTNSGFLGMLSGAAPSAPDAGNGAGEAALALERAPAGNAPVATVVDNENGDLFQRVSLRYQATRDRLQQLEWSTPYNRFNAR